MKKTSLCLLATVVLAGCQSIPESDERIPYLTVTRLENARAIVEILKCLEQTGCDSLLGEHLQCGPFLWRQLKDHPALANVGTRTQFTVPETDASGASHDVTLEGARFDNAEQVRAFWKAFSETIPPARLQRIRWLKTEENRIYWTLTRDTIREPVFIVEGRRERILIQITRGEQRLTVTFIDNLEQVAIHD
jgi:hypothetical protein